MFVPAQALRPAANGKSDGGPHQNESASNAGHANEATLRELHSHPGATLDAMLRAYTESQLTSADAALTARVREFIGA